jgi:serpin B
MSRHYFGLLVLLACSLLTLVACGDADDPVSPAGGRIVKSELARNTQPQVLDEEMQALVVGNNAFAFELYRGIVKAQDEPGNVFASPFSISLALAMAYGGARGETAAEMAEVLHFDLDSERLHNAFNGLDQELNSLDGEAQGPRLHVANAFWAALQVEFMQPFLELLAVNYGAGIHLMDFLNDSEGARLEINAWVAEQTEDKILDLLPEGSLSSDVIMVITNAIYFYADWSEQFNESNTHPRDFVLSDGSVKSVDMMSRTDPMRYHRSATYQAVELPYKGEQLAMLIVLPDDLAAFEAGLEPGMLTELFGLLGTTPVSLKLPKFEMTLDVQLSKVLAEMGMAQAFGGADFTGITEGGLSLAEVYHKAYVRVDEKGTEAAAATAVVADTSMVESESMFVNRPFFFLIRDRQSGTILFMGRVLEP